MWSGAWNKQSSLQRSHTQQIPSKLVYRALEWWSGGCGFKPQWGNFDKIYLFCVTLDLSDNLIETRIVKKWLIPSVTFFISSVVNIIVSATGKILWILWTDFELLNFRSMSVFNQARSIPGFKQRSLKCLVFLHSLVFLCSKKYVHGICIFGSDDLHHLQTKTHLVANKFLFDFEYAALHCVGEWLRNKTMKPIDLDLTKYKMLPFVHSNKLMKSQALSDPLGSLSLWVYSARTAVI